MNNINSGSTPGEMSKNEEIISTIESLMTGENDQRIIENLEMYHDAGRGSRISIFHENIESSEKIMMMRGVVYEKMKGLVKDTSETKKEHAFLVLGTIVQNGNYFFESIASDMDISDELKEKFYERYPECKTGDSAADLNIMMVLYRQAIDDHIEKVKVAGGKPLISLGHTHPNVSESYGNYSLPDIVGFSAQEEAIRGERSEEDFEYCHIVLPENGDVDCIIFDKNQERFKKIVNVASFGNENTDLVPAYTFESPKSLSDASYEKEQGESEVDKMYDDCVEEIIRRHQWAIN